MNKFYLHWSRRRSRVKARKLAAYPSFLLKTHSPLKKTLAITLLCLLLAGLAVLAYILRDIPSPQKLKDAQAFGISTQIYDRNGVLLYEVFDEKRRTPIAIKDLPPYVYQASIAIEDQNFYSHIGFDISGIARALRNTLFKQQLQGGSTITQQLVKTVLLTRERTLQRKVKEAVLTLATEVIYRKNEILEMYLNNIPYGGTTYGIEAAAQTYFGKKAKDLSLAEAAFLAGLPQSPSRYSPFGAQPELAKQRQKDVLRRMVEDKYVTQTQADEASAASLVFASPKVNINAPHFALYVRDLLMEKYSEQMVERGGLRVRTSLDLSIQKQAQASLSAELAKLEKLKVGNGAALITKPKTGEILAMIGSRDFFDSARDGQVNVTMALRQPGSSIKPLNVVTALQKKIATPATTLLDIPTCFLVNGQKPYCPKNYDGSFRGPVQTRFFLGNSLNIPEVKLLAMNGIQTFINAARSYGISTWDHPENYGLSLTLGGGEVRMVDMAVAFGSFANGGVRVPLHPILKVEDFNGNVLEEYKPEETEAQVDTMTADPTINRAESNPELAQDTSKIARVLDREPTYLLSHILLDNNARVGAFGSNSKLVVKGQTISVKTGTTNDLKDNWTIGYTPEILTAVWVGNNDNKPMNQALVSGVTGAAPIWNSIMTFLLQDKKPLWPVKPENIIDKPICTLTGLLPPADNSCPVRNEFFWKGTEPTTSGDVISRDIWIKPETGLPPKEGESTDNLQLQRHTLLSDPFVKEYCLDCTRPVNEQGKTTYEQYNVNMDAFQYPPAPPAAASQNKPAAR